MMQSQAEPQGPTEQEYVPAYGEEPTPEEASEAFDFYAGPRGVAIASPVLASLSDADLDEFANTMLDAYASDMGMSRDSDSDEGEAYDYDYDDGSNALEIEVDENTGEYAHFKKLKKKLKKLKKLTKKLVKIAAPLAATAFGGPLAGGLVGGLMNKSSRKATVEGAIGSVLPPEVASVAQQLASDAAVYGDYEPDELQDESSRATNAVDQAWDSTEAR